MIHPLTLTIFHPSETTAVESRSRNVWMEWNEGESLCRATRLNDISLPPTAPPEKDITSKKIFFGESTSCRLQTRGREREWEGGEKVFLRHVALICSPAANENDDLQKVFFFFFFLSLGTESALAKHIAGGTLWTSVIFIVWWIPQRRLIGRDPALTLISLIKVLRLCWICDQWQSVTWMWS